MMLQCYMVYLIYVLADGIAIILYFISVHFIIFIQLYPDVMGNYVLRLYGLFNLLCFGIGKIYFPMHPKKPLLVTRQKLVFKNKIYSVTDKIRP